uniref:Gag-Pol polyprotein n=1 Tax=Tanacetum cinerariifolium TaxID=118510 RepID=A0A6L2M9Y4_TANCI|nr:hypothetical protein [Tanacetum cinerariifolium]
MDDPGITMEEYIWLQTEISLRKGKVYNWETATYGNIRTPSVERPVPPSPTVQVPVVLAESSSEESSSGDVSLETSTQVIQPHNHLRKWSKDHPMDNVIGNPSCLVSTKKPLAIDALWCLYNYVLLKVKPKNVKTAMDEACWFKAMQEEIYEFDRLQYGN